MSEWKQYRLGEKIVETNPRVLFDNNTNYPFIEMKDLDSDVKYVKPQVRREIKSGARFCNKETPCLREFPPA